MKRFYKQVEPHESAAGYEIRLDGRPVKTPGGVCLLAPGKSLATAVAAEWQAQGEEIIPDSMPLTQILTTAQERVAQARPVMQAQVLNYLDTDLLCYPAGEPADLAARESERRAPWLDWFADTYGARLETTTGLAAVRHPEAAHEAVRETVEAMDDFHFTVLQLVTGLSGSLVLALAFINRACNPEDLFAAVHVEEQHKAALYNEDVHGPAPLEEKKQAAFRRDAEAAWQFLDLI
ncbi:MAG: ATP12 chaperone family protein [Rhodospirillales bacterium]|nr:ATP12 chaperone family protein [Rhodospirillales bacterium]